MLKRFWITRFFLTGILCFALGWSLVFAQSPAKTEAPLSLSTKEKADDPFGRLHPEAPPETAQWGQLAGIWDCTIESSSPDGAAKQRKSRWTWAYILDGHAIQDTYVGYDQDSRPNFYGSGVRIYNPGQKKWEISWIANKIYPNKAHRITPFQATYEDGQMVMKNVEGSDPSWRTVFFDIRADSFEWKSKSSPRMSCKRAH